MKELRMLLFLALFGQMSLASAQQFEVKSVEGRRIEITHRFDSIIPKATVDFLKPYKDQVDEMMMPVLGESNSYMKVYRPESPLSNLIADILRDEAEDVLGHEVDLGVCNIGGIRSSLPQGKITVGDILEVAPFENMYCAVSLKGDVLMELFRQIAAVKGEGLSGARLKISEDGELLEALVDGKPVSKNKVYRVATLDYLSEGNDKLYAFKKSVGVEMTTLPVREVLMNYIRKQASKGLKIDSKTDGRITVVKKEGGEQ